MGKAVTVYTLAWDNDGGCGCEVFATQSARDEALREALASYLHDQLSANLTLPDLLERLERDDFVNGARYARDAHTLKIPAHAA